MAAEDGPAEPPATDSKGRILGKNGKSSLAIDRNVSESESVDPAIEAFFKMSKSQLKRLFLSDRFASVAIELKDVFPGIPIPHGATIVERAQIIDDSMGDNLKLEHSRLATVQQFHREHLDSALRPAPNMVKEPRRRKAS